MSAQARQNVSGRVVNGQDRALAAMTVRLVQEAAEPDLQPPDVVEVATDEQGRFRAAVLFGAAYVARAFGPVGGDGTRLVADEVFPVQAGSTPLLRATPRAPVAWSKVEGFAAWRAEGPLRLVALAGGRLGDETELGDPTVAGWRPPPLFVADGRSDLELRDARGEVLTGLLFQPPFALAVPPPTELDVLIVDDKGAPIAGAKVMHVSWRTSVGRGDLYQLSRNRWRTRVAGVTDARGQCRVRVCHWDPIDKIKPVLLVEHPDGGQVLTWQANNEPPIATWRNAAPMQVRIVCAPPPPITGRALVGKEPLAGVIAEVHTGVGPLWTTRGENAADGTFRLPGIPVQHDTGFLHLRLRWLDPVRAASEPQFVLPELRGQGSHGHLARDFGDLDLAPFRGVGLQVLDARNGPGREAAVLLFAIGAGSDASELSPFRFATDAAGRVPNLLCAPGRWLAFASNGRESGFTVFDGSARTVAIAMQAMPVVACVVRDADGKKAAGASVYAEHWPDANRAGDREHFLVRRCEWLPQRTWGRPTGTDGRTELSLPAWCFDGGALVASRATAAGWVRSPRVVLEPSSIGQTIELRLP